MTFPITDDQVERAARAMGHAFPNPDEHCRKYVRSILEAALDRRKGERDRRKVRDGKLRYYGFEGDERRVKSTGRREGDKLCWHNLPLSEPPIQVSLKMRSAVMKAIQRGFESFRCRDSLGAAADEIAQAVLRVEIEEARRIEEQKAQPPQSVIDTIMGSLKPFLAEKWAGNSQIAWQVFGDLVRRGDLVFKDAPCGAAVQHSHLRSSDINFESCLRHPLGPPRRTHRRKGDPK